MPSRKRTHVEEQKIKKDVNKTEKKGISVRSAAKVFNVSKSHLHRLVVKDKEIQSKVFIYKPSIGNRKIFSVEQEYSLADNLKPTTKICHGLKTKQVTELSIR